MNLRTLTTHGGRCRGKGRARGAFTFAEVLAAMLFMAIVIPVAMQGVQLASRAGVVAQRKCIATRLADMKMNEIMAIGTWSNSTPRGSFDGRYRDYTWSLRSEKWTDPNMKLLTMEVWYTVQNKEYSVRVWTLGQGGNQ